ncbi:MAG: Hsp20/alpha crystallin family protein [Treponema sp.]|jgi:HSP20 family protein|nr:Hsp20/alpha crystallin family protein [Treponema sp.]
MKAVTLYRPRVIENALTGFDHYLDSFFGDSFLNPADRIFNRFPAVDVRETEKSYVLEADLPGFDEKDIEIHLDGNTLTIQSKNAEEKKEEKNGYMVQERRQASFSRSFTLPDNADRESISAAYKNGVLSVEIVKQPEAQKRVIEISKK